MDRIVAPQKAVEPLNCAAPFCATANTQDAAVGCLR